MKTVIKTYIFLLVLLCAIGVDAQELVPGSVIGRHIYGLANDYQGDPVLIEDRPIIHTKSSFEQLINVGKSRFIISGFNARIGSLYVTQVDPETNNNIDTVALELESIDGLNHPVAGITTAWNSVLFTESQPLNAAHPEEFVSTFKSFYKGKANLVNSYNYGWVSEVIVLDSKGLAKAIKDYAVGRLFANQVLIMPDGKTVYLLDVQGNFYLFIAEQPNSLAKGELYAIYREQKLLKHTLLGKSSALKVKFKLKDITFDSIFKSSVPRNQHCAKSFKYINTIYGEECLKIIPKNKNYTAFFEPLRVLALQDIPRFSSEKSRMTYDAKSNQLKITQSDQPEIILGLGTDPEINSQFIVKEPQ